jgi:HlyD family secretion protein
VSKPPPLAAVAPDPQRPAGRRPQPLDAPETSAAPPPAQPRRPALRLLALALVLIAASMAVGLVWRSHRPVPLPPGIVSTNGRIEATQVDVASKIAGRLLELGPHEGDMVDAGAVVARLDPADIEAQLRRGRAEAQRARDELSAAAATADSRRGELAYAEAEFRRARTLLDKGFASHALVDQRRQQLTSAEAANRAAAGQVAQARSAIAAADAEVDRLQTALRDTTLTAPVRGRVEYRLVEPGAVLGAGGRVLTLLDLADVWMTVYLPAGEAGRLAIGDEARVVLDAAPGYVFPATVAYVAAEAQFTPKTVETASEREKLMFRVKLQADPALLRRLEPKVKAGLRGIAYLRVQTGSVWPARLAVALPAP